MTETISLEEFESRRRSGRDTGQGPTQRFIRGLVPLTPTVFESAAKTPAVAQSSVRSTWRGGPKSAVALVDEKGGTLKSTIIDGVLWVVWYPASGNGAS